MRQKTLVIICIACSLSLFAQKGNGIYGDSNWLSNWTNFKPATAEYPEPNEVLPEIINKDTKLVSTKTYQLNNRVYVTNNATLTIEPGTIIRAGVGDIDYCGTLIITKGAKLIAEGTEKAPIVFTSDKAVTVRKPGNWGGIIILGNAPVNKIDKDNKHVMTDFNIDLAQATYGGDKPEDNSGVLKYVRIEYAGKKINGSKEINALILGGVGKKTIIDHVQISYSNGDAFYLAGGEINMNNLISFRCDDDDFDFSEGVQATITNSIAIRHPFSSGSGNSRCFEIDSYDKPENADLTKKLTNVKANNITFVNIEENNQGLVREAIYLKENCNLSFTSSVVSGFAPFLLLGEKITLSPDNFSKIELKNVMLNRCKENLVSEEQSYNGKLKYWPDPASMFDMTSTPITDLFTSVDLKNNPDFRKKESPILVNNR
ncbi:hypothetical protein [Flavobacterium polysaccharolyticum]|uniref:Uncharacterized protein n=1 Tax=Flavobacterium polysaccharolyticum TaxID=3133148 RepID=A0ABU9NSP2_9FLAO